MTYRFVIRGYKCLPYIRKCLDSLVKQPIKNWTAIIVIDPSNESGHILDLVLKEYGHYPINTYLNDDVMGVCHNIYSGTQMVINGNEDDIVCYLDADDKLKIDALQKVEKTYKKYKCLATCGSFISILTKKLHHWNRFYPRRADHRKYKFSASHFKTVKAKVLKTIPCEYFMYRGHWGKAAWLENVRHIKEGIYVYREGTKHNMNRDLQRRWKRIWQKKRPLKRLF
jgi:glycosyltransferase involved in cell wall biosynthesis